MHVMKAQPVVHTTHLDICRCACLRSKQVRRLEALGGHHGDEAAQVVAPEGGVKQRTLACVPSNVRLRGEPVS